MMLSIGVNPGGVGGSRPPRFWGGGRKGGHERGLGKHYSLFCTESRAYVRTRFYFRLSNQKERKLAKNVGVKGENVNILGEKTIF